MPSAKVWVLLSNRFTVISALFRRESERGLTVTVETTYFFIRALWVRALVGGNCRQRDNTIFSFVTKQNPLRGFRVRILIYKIRRPSVFMMSGNAHREAVRLELLS